MARQDSLNDTQRLYLTNLESYGLKCASIARRMYVEMRGDHASMPEDLVVEVIKMFFASELFNEDG